MSAPTNLPLPVGAVRAGDWADLDQPHDAFRIVYGRERSVGGPIEQGRGFVTSLAEVEASVCQRPDGQLDPPEVKIFVHSDDGLSAEQARAIAVHLIDAAREVDQWATDAMPALVPPTECAPWCEGGDGHPRSYSRQDQTCWGPSTYVDLSLHPPVCEDGAEYPQSVGVAAYRSNPDAEATVNVHLRDIQLHDGKSIDYGLDLTAAEARILIDGLRDAADMTEGQR